MVGCGDNHGNSGNRAFYENSDVDRLIEEGRRETDPAKREEIYLEAAEHIAADAPWVPIWFDANLDGYRHNDLEGFEAHPSGRHFLWEIELVD